MIIMYKVQVCMFKPIIILKTQSEVSFTGQVFVTLSTILFCYVCVTA